MKKYIVIILCSNALFAKNPALKNFREIYSSLGYSTNIAPDSALQKIYEVFKDTLPKMGSVSEYSSPLQLGVIQLSGAFCERRIALDSGLPPTDRWFYKSIDFTKGPQSLTNEQRLELLGDSVDVFWQRSLSMDEKPQLLSAVNELVSESGNTPDDMKVFLTLLCVIFGTSTDFLTI